MVDEADGKQPHLFTAADCTLILAFTGLWDRRIDPATKQEILSCTVIVSGSSEWMTPYHYNGHVVYILQYTSVS